MRTLLVLATLLCAAGAAAQPTRAIVALEPEEREFVLAEMREFLSMLERITGALARQDFEAVAADAARRDARHTLEQSARLLGTCNACHAAFQFAR